MKQEGKRKKIMLAFLYFTASEFAPPLAGPISTIDARSAYLKELK